MELETHVASRGVIFDVVQRGCLDMGIVQWLKNFEIEAARLRVLEAQSIEYFDTTRKLCQLSRRIHSRMEAKGIVNEEQARTAHQLFEQCVGDIARQGTIDDDTIGDYRLAIDERYHDVAAAIDRFNFIETEAN